MQTIVANACLIHPRAWEGSAPALDMRRALLVIIMGMKGFWDSDTRLVRAILAGDTAAWQKFILQYSNFIYGAIVRYTDDYDEKMAVYLHVLEKLHEDGCERLRRFAFQSKLSTWLTVVARRLALDFLRAKYGRDFALKKIRVVSIDGEPDYTKILADTVTPETTMAADERRDLRRQLEKDLQQALDRLDDRERLAMQMIYFQGMRIGEVGRLLQQRAAYKFVARTLKKIRVEMERASRLERTEIRDALEGEAHD